MGRGGIPWHSTRSGWGARGPALGRVTLGHLGQIYKGQPSPLWQLSLAIVGYRGVGSSGGESARLISVRSEVQVLPDPP